MLYDPQTRSELQTGQPYPSKNNTPNKMIAVGDRWLKQAPLPSHGLFRLTLKGCKQLNDIRPPRLKFN